MLNLKCSNVVSYVHIYFPYLYGHTSVVVLIKILLQCTIFYIVHIFGKTVTNQNYIY